jgi:hypothetical protein
MAAPRIKVGEPVVRLPPQKEINAMDKGMGYETCKAMAASASRNASCIEAMCAPIEQPMEGAMCISGRLMNILDRLNGGCKAMVELVGVPEGAKDKEAVDPVSRMDNIEEFLETIEYRVGELLAQIDRMGKRLG